MQTNVVVLPLDPHGPIRDLHDRIKGSGLLYERPRFTFTPHVTLSFFPEPTAANLRAMLALRIDEPVALRRIQCHETLDLTRTRLLLELELTPAPAPTEDIHAPIDRRGAGARHGPRGGGGVHAAGRRVSGADARRDASA